MKYFGNLLSGYDVNGNGKVERDAFYRVIDSMKLGIGEGDIQELLKSYDPMKNNEIQISSFADDLNMHISNPDYRI